MTDVLHHPSRQNASTHNDAGVSHAGPRTCIRNVRAVTPSGTVDNATVTIHGGVIVEVTERGTPSPGAIDGRGAFLLPGLVDTHSDGLAKESTPRPRVQFPM